MALKYFTCPSRIAKLKIPTSRAAFTLIEMTTSIAIIALVAVLFIANYHSSIRQTDLTMTAQKLVADIHAAQSDTLGLIKYNGLLPAGGWGLHFDTTQSSYVLFADLNAPGENGYTQYDPATEGQTAYGARTTDLSASIRISRLELGSQSVGQANVTFLPPDPQTNLVSGNSSSTVLLIELKNQETNACRTVRVNFLGLAELLDTNLCSN